MRRRMLALATAMTAVLAAAPARADVTIVSTTTGKGGPFGIDGESRTYLKGSKMRTELVSRGKRFITIVDLDKQQFISLDEAKREAEVTEMAEIARTMQAFKTDQIRARAVPTGEKKAILGYNAEEYEMSVVLPMEGGDKGNDLKLTIAMGGPVWLSKDAPGAEDYRTFYQTAAEKGFIFTDPRAAKAQPGQARGMLEFYRRMADKGVPLVTTMQMKFEGGGPMGAMMSRMGGMNFTTTVTQITEGPLDDSLFAIPAGYKVKQNR